MTNLLLKLQNFIITCSDSTSKSLQKAAYRLMPDTVKIPLLEHFTGKHDGETLRQFNNLYNTYLKLTGVKDENAKALLVKTRLSDIVCTW